jgi:hypothetical protein
MNTTFIEVSIKKRNHFAFLTVVMIALVCFPVSVIAQKKAGSINLETNLIKAGKNRPELEKAITYFKRSKDPQKLEALYFLISNMDIHYSANYTYVDSTGKTQSFNEFSYPNFRAAEKIIKENYEQGTWYFQEDHCPDLECITADYLIANIENAFKSWRNSLYKNIAFKDFCEYILPYRATVEPLQEWRNVYGTRFKWISDSLRTLPFNKVLSYIGAEYMNWFTFTFGREIRVEPLPRLGAQQLLFREKGACEDVAGLEVFILRSQGIPASYNLIPRWGTSTGTHFLNTAFDPQMRPVRFDVTMQPAIDIDLPREPAKVIRFTYSKQPEVLANIEKEENIPPGFLQYRNYKDITNEYWETDSLKTELFPSTDNPAISYACIVSGGKWQPVWWGKTKDNLVTFSNMPKGIAYLPAYYKDQELVPAGYVKVMGYNNEAILIPDYSKKRVIEIKEQEKYLKFRPDKTYQLYYWDNTWILAGEQTATEETKALLFSDVPSNVLFMLIPEYSKGLERPFIIDNNGTRYWF